MASDKQTKIEIEPGPQTAQPLELPDVPAHHEQARLIPPTALGEVAVKPQIVHDATWDLAE